jgi:hypothetical protein
MTLDALMLHLKKGAAVKSLTPKSGFQGHANKKKKLEMMTTLSPPR